MDEAVHGMHGFPITFAAFSFQEYLYTIGGMLWLKTRETRDSVLSLHDPCRVLSISYPGVCKGHSGGLDR